MTNGKKKVDEIYIPNEKFVINNLVLSEVLNIVSKRSKTKLTHIYNVVKLVNFDS